MMATVPHVISGLGLRKFQADGFLLTGVYNILRVFPFDATTYSGPRPPHSRRFLITHNDAPQSVGLLSTSDQLVAETST